MFESFGDISSEEFFSSYWRQKPLFIPGGAEHFLDFTFSPIAFRTVAKKMRESTPQLVDGKEGVIFLQNMDAVSPIFRKRSQEVERLTSCRPAWHDAVQVTEDGEGLGCHYDHSDNFVLQQSGVKLWKLAPPSIIPVEEQRRRMLNDPTLGGIWMPDDCYEFVLEPGDALYIPLLWPHWGISQGRSLSVSLVLNATTPLTMLLPVLKDLLSEEEAWWRAIPFFQTPNREGPAPDLPVEMAQLLGQLTESLQGDRLREALPGAAWERGVWALAPESVSNTTEDTTSAYGMSLKTDLDWKNELGLEMERFSTEPREWSDEELVALIEVGKQELLELVGPRRVHIQGRKLQEALAIGQIKYPDLWLWMSFQVLLECLQKAPDKAWLPATLHPEFQGLLWRLEEAAQHTYAPRFKEVASRLLSPLFCLAVLTEELGSCWLRLEPDTPHHLRLELLGLQIRSEEAWPDNILDFWYGPAGFSVQAQHKDLFSLQMEQLLNAKTRQELAPGFWLEPLPRVGENGPFLALDRSWLDITYPGAGRFGATMLDPNPTASEQEHLQDAYTSAWNELQSTWPEAAEEAEQRFLYLAARAAGKEDARLESVRPFPGLLAARPQADFQASELAYQLGRLRAYALLEVFPFLRQLKGQSDLFFSSRSGRDGEQCLVRTLGELTRFHYQVRSSSPEAEKTEAQVRRQLESLSGDPDLSEPGGRLLVQLIRVFEEELAQRSDKTES